MLSLVHLLLTSIGEVAHIILSSQMQTLRHKGFTQLVDGRAGAQTQETSHHRAEKRGEAGAGEGCRQGTARFLSSRVGRSVTEFPFGPSGCSPYRHVTHTSSVSQLPPAAGPGPRARAWTHISDPTSPWPPGRWPRRPGRRLTHGQRFRESKRAVRWTRMSGGCAGCSGQNVVREEVGTPRGSNCTSPVLGQDKHLLPTKARHGAQLDSRQLNCPSLH